MIYPVTKRADLVEEQFGHRIADPYRWLENDARRDPDVAAWVAAQNRATAAHLEGLPGRALFRDRLTALLDHERLTVPHRRGTRHVFTRNAGLDNQPVLVLRDGVDGQDRVLIDPNAWSEDGTTALAEWSVSEDGRRVAFAVQEAGTDWRTIRVLDIDSGTILDDSVAWVRFSGISWAADGSGFFYSRFPEPGEGASAAPVTGHAVYFHALGTAQPADRLVHATPQRPHLVNLAEVTEDGRYAVILSTPGSGGNALTVIDLATPGWTSRALVEGFDTAWTVVGNVGPRFYLLTQDGAERGRLVTLELGAAPPGAAPPGVDTLVAERDAVMNGAALVGNRLLVSWLVDAKTEVERFTLDGTPDGSVDLPGIGTAGGFRGRATEQEAFFAFTGYDTPTTIYRYDVARNTRTVWARPEVGIDLGAFAVEQRFAASKDGTRVPIFVLRRAGADGPAPTVLYGYGGYGISMVPYYSPAALAWVEAGGVYAFAAIRGGGEYGKAWHDAGRRANKRNVFDDFIAAGEYLKAEGIAAQDGLAIQGDSNGGLLVGAVVNQRPDLFAAALPGVGVMDMLRFHRFTGGGLWIEEFGDPEKEEEFRNLLSYSPLHNIRAGRSYPAMLVTTADTDDRVVPGHSFKYVAALQAADLGPHPRLLRVETRAGHGAGKPIGKVIEEIADLWSFAARWTGLRLGG
jgi:prolyl oligopeptidase